MSTPASFLDLLEPCPNDRCDHSRACHTDFNPVCLTEGCPCDGPEDLAGEAWGDECGGCGTCSWCVALDEGKRYPQ